MQSNNKNEVIEGLRNLIAFLICAFLIVWAGTTEKWYILTPVSTGLMAGFGYLAGGGSIKSTIGWGAIGLAAGLLWSLFGV
jgi:hypothetical protein